MEISVRIEKVLDVQQVTSRQNGKTYNKYSFVGSTTNEQYPKKICFTVFGDEKWNELGGIEVGRSYSLSIDLSSREWQGRWYTEASVWKAVAIGVESPASVAPQPVAQQAQYAQTYEPQPQPQPQGGSDGLPF